MAKVTPKENFMKLVNGGHPDYVPYYTMMGEPYLGEAADVMAAPDIFPSDGFVAGGKDMWGVPQAAPSVGCAAAMPDTSYVMLEDINDWSKVIKFPKANDIDFEKCYEAQIKQFNIDRTQSCVKVGPSLMPFQELVAIMGFEGGLTALYTDPEEVKAMLNAMVDHIEPYFEKMLDVFKPDIWSMGDDTCAKTTPFFSPEIYKDVFLPIYHRLAKPAYERGIPIAFHICGRIDDFVPYMLEFGCKYTDPIQEINSIPEFRKKFPGISYCGGWEWALHMPENYPTYDEEEIRQSVRDIIDKNSKDGGYAFYHSGLVSYAGDPVIEEIRKIVRDEAHWYGRKVYGYTGE